MKSPVSLIDLHCDTLSEICHKNASLLQNDFAISLETVEPFDHYAQFFASWCSRRLNDDDGYAAFLQMADYLDAQLADPEIAKRAIKVKTADELDQAWQQGKAAAILAIEDARILGGQIERLDELASRGVRYATLQWGGDTCIGGAHDTENPLTPFGKDVVRRCFALGIVPDISHTCKQSAQDALDLAVHYEKPVIASHSNSYTVYPHTRNLRDEHFGIIRDLGGLVGLNFYRAHLRDCSEQNATVSDLVRHLEYFLSLGGENTVAIGGDWDGAQLPDGFSNIADVRILQDELLRLGYDNELIDKLFWKNAYDFIHRAFI